MTLADLELVDAFLMGVDRALFGEAESSRIWLELDWSSDWVDLPSMSRIVFVEDGSLVAYANLEAVDPAERIGAFGRVHPDHLGRGLGTSLVRWTRQVATGLAPSGAATMLRHSISGADAAARELLERDGFAHVRTAWHMAMDLPPVYDADAVPEGVTIRPSVAGDDDRGIWETMDSAFRSHFGFEPVSFERWWDNTRRTGDYDPSLILVAESGSLVVGASQQFVPPGSDVGWVGELGVRPGFQGRGIGRALLRRALADLAARGLRRAQLNVDSQNESGAVGLYRSVGMHVTREWLDLDATVEGVARV